MVLPNLISCCCNSSLVPEPRSLHRQGPVSRRGRTDWLIGRDNYEIYKVTQQYLIRSDYVIRAALRDPDVKKLSIVAKQKDADRWLAQHIVTSFPRDGEVMNVSVTADTPDETAYADSIRSDRVYQRSR